MASARQLWDYESLAGRKDMFRLLLLYLDEDHEPLRCMLRPKPLDDPPHYYAISYVWGDPSKTETITVLDDYVCEITASLASALRDVRTNTRVCTKRNWPDREGVSGMWIWCDGICIDQTNLAEKADQVMLMGSIYRRADQVFIHTGAEIPGAQDLPGFVERAFKWGSREWKTKWSSTTSNNTSLEDAELDELPPAEDPRWLHLKSFLYRPWPRRSWITQEAVLAKRSPTLLYGPYEILFKAPHILFNFSARGILPMSLYTYHSDEDDRHTAMIGSLMALSRTRVRREDKTLDVTLNELLYHCYDSACSDPRDKIYSLANLASDWNLLNIEIDYSIPVERLYKAVATKILKTSNSALILALVGAKQLILPSWVPDFSETRRGGFLTKVTGRTRDTGSYVYSAGGDEPGIIHVDEEEGILKLRAALLDRISFVSEMIDVQEKELLQKLKNCGEVYNQRYPRQVYLNGQSVEHATGLTWIAGRASTSERMKMDAFLEGFNHWCNSNGDRDESKLNDAARLSGALKDAADCRRWAMTRSGYMGLVPGTAQLEDNVYVVAGAQTPFIIRQSGLDNLLVGECYIHGIMDGEALRSGAMDFREITLI